MSGIKNNNQGFTLVEIIVSLVLLGILAVFTGMLLTRGITSYSQTRAYAETGLEAQAALYRIALELEDLSAISGFVTDTSITYTSNDANLAGTRTLAYGSGTLSLNDNVLLDKLSGFTLSQQLDDMDNDGSADDVAYIDLGITLDLGDITTTITRRIYPRISL